MIKSKERYLKFTIKLQSVSHFLSATHFFCSLGPLQAEFHPLYPKPVWFEDSLKLVWEAQEDTLRLCFCRCKCISWGAGTERREETVQAFSILKII